MELLRLREEGVFLGVLSKNDEHDFSVLCLTRSDFLLRADHFSATSIGWHSKAEGLTRIAEQLRVAPNAMLVVDDNPAELAQIRAAHGDAHVLHARNPEQTLFWLRHYPTLNEYRANATTALRVNDLTASRKREGFHASSSGTDYIREMQIELSYALNPITARRRLAELSQKTNQFNTGLQRYFEMQVGKRLEAPDHYTIAIGMRDRFSDSGTIGAIFARKEGDSLLIEEICISCRALGRDIESVMIARALAPIMDQHGLSTVGFTFRQGPRNQPARTWLTTFSGTADIPDHGRVTVAWDAIRRSEHFAAPVASKWEQQ
jgi:FkbH-like protein